MKQNEISAFLSVKGMTCSGCEFKIENTLVNKAGILKANVKYSEKCVKVIFDPSRINLQSISQIIEDLGYHVETVDESNKNQLESESPKAKNKGASIILGVLILIVITLLFLSFTIDPSLRRPGPGVGYGILLVFGLFSPLFCALTWSVNIAVCTSYKSDRDDQFSRLKPSILFNSGRVISNTVMGGVLGSIGAAIGAAPNANVVVSIVAGLFLIVMGLNMLSLFPTLQKMIPRMPKIFGNKAYGKIGSSGPLVIGLLSAFMPCGPLQTMQLFALGTGSLVSGALAMFLYTIGTLPLMFGFGAASSTMSERFRSKMMKIGAIMVMIMGVGMLVGVLF